MPDRLNDISSVLGEAHRSEDNSPRIIGIIDGILSLAVERKADELRFEPREDDNLTLRLRIGNEWSALPALDCTQVVLARLLFVAALSIIPDDRVTPQIGWVRIHGVSMIFKTQPLAHCRENIRIWIDWNSARPWLDLDGIEAGDVSAIITRADELSDEGHLRDASLLCDQLLSEQPDCGAAFTVKGFCYRNDGEARRSAAGRVRVPGARKVSSRRTEFRASGRRHGASRLARREVDVRRGRAGGTLSASVICPI
ncbi:MAG TPA: hypothetical protein VF980_00240 [Thermoanaerobaculia bacterium]